MKKIVRKLVRWALKDEIDQLNVGILEIKVQINRVKQVLGNIDVGVDVHEYDNKYSPSWAVISIQGKRTDFIKFIDLGQREIIDIQQFLRHFDRSKVDASPHATQFLKCTCY